ncbi:hypothetical protein TNCV_1723331 [Trichonephila clavipes]|nr:hypothetical protein TNCV_1723331 [Trichonephila clavipes]
MAAAIKLNEVPLIPRSAPFSSFLLVGVGIGNNGEEGFLIPRQLVENCEGAHLVGSEAVCPLLWKPASNEERNRVLVGLQYLALYLRLNQQFNS